MYKRLEVKISCNAFIYNGLERIWYKRHEKTKCTFTWILCGLLRLDMWILCGFRAWLFGLSLERQYKEVR